MHNAVGFTHRKRSLEDILKTRDAPQSGTLAVNEDTFEDIRDTRHNWNIGGKCKGHCTINTQRRG